MTRSDVHNDQCGLPWARGAPYQALAVTKYRNWFVTDHHLWARRAMGGRVKMGPLRDEYYLFKVRVQSKYHNVVESI